MFTIHVDANGLGFVKQDGVTLQRVRKVELTLEGGMPPKAVIYADPESVTADVPDENVEIVVNEVTSNGDS